jgi:CHAT domain-containing protein
MRLAHVGMVAVVVGCMAASQAGAAQPSSRLRQLQTAYGKAQALFTEGLYADAAVQGELAVHEAARAGDKRELAQRLELLGVIYGADGDYARAEPLLVRALELRETLLGKGAPEVAHTLNNLAELYRGRGLYARAEPLHARALAIQEAALGKNHPEVAQTLTSLGQLYAEQEAYGRAEPLYTRALNMIEQVQGADHPDATRVLTLRGDLAVAQKLYEAARPFYAQALAIQEKTLGWTHPEVAVPLNRLASLELSQRHYVRAASLAQRALALQEIAFGYEDARLAVSLNNLAQAFVGQSLPGKAEPLYERALALRQAALGRNHPSMVELLHNLALLRMAQGRSAEALPLLMRAFAIPEFLLRKRSLGFSESRLASFLEHLRSEEDLLYELVRQQPGALEVRHAALAAALLRKGRSLQETAEVSRAIYGSLSAQDRESFERLQDVRAQMATLWLQGGTQLTPRDYQQRLQELSAEADALEAELATRSARVRALTTLPPPEDMVDRIAAVLPRDSALVEIIAYTDREQLRIHGMLPGLAIEQLRYLALVLGPDGQTCVSDLGNAKPIDLVASRLRVALARRDSEYLKPAQALYRLIFEPLLLCLGDTRHVYLSPDGELGLVSFAALHDGQQFLVDTYDFTYVTSGKDLLPRPQPPAPLNSMVVLADPSEGSRTGSLSASRQASFEFTDRSVTFEPSVLQRSELTQRAWGPLPGSRREAHAIQRLFPRAQLYLGAEATRQRLLTVSTPGVLHIATHGFFLEDSPSPEASRAAITFGALGEEEAAPHPPDPLLRSGLVLAGTWQPEAGAGDGKLWERAWVTALELAGLNLWGTQLVVLSACDTGRGDVKLGQGVYGLRRAFIAAGAETVVTSLWKVNDETTRELMEAYYGNLVAGQGRATALREAMRALRRTQPHPHYWAPFITLGQDTPLRMLPASAWPAKPEEHRQP